MGSIKALTLAGFAALSALPAASNAARAADLLPPPIEAPLRGAVEDPSGFYLRADFGYSNQNASNLRSTFGDGSTLASLNASDGPVGVGDSPLLGLGVGYQFNSWLRTDITGEYRPGANYHASTEYKYDAINTTTGVNSSICPLTASALNVYDTTASTACGDEYAALVKSGLFLANAYLDMGTWQGLTPYVGAGVGVVTYQVSGMKDTSLYPLGPFGFAGNRTDVNLAWALTAGASMRLTSNLLLDLSYRYTNMGTFSTGQVQCNNQAFNNCHFETQHFGMSSNDVRVGLRWMLGDPRVAVLDPGLGVPVGGTRSRY